MPTRRDAVLHAAVQVLGTSGARGFTHRAVDRAAAVPDGTTSNYFRTRDALVSGVLSHISDLEAEPIGAMLPARLTVDAVVAIAADRIEFLLGPGRVLTLARHALFLEAAWNPELRPDLVTQSQRWWQLGADLLARLGVDDAQRRGRWLFAYIDGLLADQLARPDDGFDAAAAVRAGLVGLLA